jgi:hypothetical protein
MEHEDEIQLSPDESLQESQILLTFEELLRTEKFRYEEQAHKLIEETSLETEIHGIKRSYRVTVDTYRCRVNSRDLSGKGYEIEVPIPGSQSEKMETLIELFAQSEAGSIQ